MRRENCDKYHLTPNPNTGPAEWGCGSVSRLRRSTDTIGYPSISQALNEPATLAATIYSLSPGVARATMIDSHGSAA
jgi:hypothetical protein